MSFAEIAADKPTEVRCAIGEVVANLPDDEADVLRGMLAAPRDLWPHSGGTEPRDSIQLAFRAEGHEVGEKIIRLHRAGTCKCNKASS